jgi:quercetin dioxygenase-like cupin family protein
MNTFLKMAALTCSALACLPLLAGTSRADESGAAHSQATPPLMTHDLSGIPGKEAIVLTVQMAPGAAAQPHRHDANVFVYMLEGAVIMQVKGGPRVTLHPGQTYYESPSDIHTLAQNASRTEPARFLVFIVKDKGAPITRPVAAEGLK